MKNNIKNRLMIIVLASTLPLGSVEAISFKTIAAGIGGGALGFAVLGPVGLGIAAAGELALYAKKEKHISTEHIVEGFGLGVAALALVGVAAVTLQPELLAGEAGIAAAAAGLGTGAAELAVGAAAEVAVGAAAEVAVGAAAEVAVGTAAEVAVGTAAEAAVGTAAEAAVGTAAEAAVGTAAEAAVGTTEAGAAVGTTEAGAAAGEAAAKEAAQVAAKEATKEGAKVAAKEGAKEATKEGAAKTATKAVPKLWSEMGKMEKLKKVGGVTMDVAMVASMVPMLLPLVEKKPKAAAGHPAAVPAGPGLTIVNYSPWALNYGQYVVQQCGGAGASAPIQLVSSALAVGGTVTSKNFKSCTGSIYIGTDGNKTIPAEYFRIDNVVIPANTTTATLTIDSVNGQPAVNFNNTTDQVYVSSGITSIPLTPEAASAAVEAQSPAQAAVDAAAYAAATDQVASDAATAAAKVAAANALANSTSNAASAAAVEAAKAAKVAKAAAAQSAEVAKALAREIIGSKMGVQHAQAFVKAARAKLNVDNNKIAAINKARASVVRNKALAAAKHAATLASNVVAKAEALLKAYQAIDKAKKAKPNASKATLDTLAAAAMKAELAYKKALAQK